MPVAISVSTPTLRIANAEGQRGGKTMCECVSCRYYEAVNEKIRIGEKIEDLATEWDNTV